MKLENWKLQFLFENWKLQFLFENWNLKLENCNFYLKIENCNFYLKIETWNLKAAIYIWKLKLETWNDSFQIEFNFQIGHCCAVIKKSFRYHKVNIEWHCIDYTNEGRSPTLKSFSGWNIVGNRQSTMLIPNIRVFTAHGLMKSLVF